MLSLSSCAHSWVTTLLCRRLETAARRVLYVRLCLVLVGLLFCDHVARSDDAAKPGGVSGKDRVALVIGNGDYRNYPKLPNPANDARAMAEVLKSDGFEIYGGHPLIDADKNTMDDAIRGFGLRIINTGAALFYYAGHGIQVDGRNYMLPISAKIERLSDVKYEMIDVNDILDLMQEANDKLNVVFLDACRNNPIGEGGLRGITVGLAQINAPRGTVLAYATAPGKLARDGAGKHSPYTRAIVKTLKQPGLPLLEALNRISLEVQEATNGEQVPWSASSGITGNFYFIEPTTGALDLKVSPPDATLRLDGEEKGKADGYRDQLKAGTHEYEITAPGFATEHSTVNIKPGDQQSVRVVLGPTARPPAPPPRPTAATLELAVVPPEAILKLDGAEVGPAKGFRQDLPAGVHKIELSAQGYQTHQERVTLPPGADRSIEIALLPVATTPPPPPPPTTGMLVLQVATPGATVRLDGEPAGLAKGFRRQIKAGEHEIEIAADGYEPSRQKIAIAAGAATNLVLTLVAIPQWDAKKEIPEKSTGTISVTTEPNSALITIDGKRVGSPGSAELGVSPGKHVVAASANGWVAQRLTIGVNAGERVQVPLQLIRKVRPRVVETKNGPPGEPPASAAAAAPRLPPPPVPPPAAPAVRTALPPP